MDRITAADLSDLGSLVARAAELRSQQGRVHPLPAALSSSSAGAGWEVVYELTHVRADGSRAPASVSVIPLQDSRNRVIGYL